MELYFHDSLFLPYPWMVWWNDHSLERGGGGIDRWQFQWSINFFLVFLLSLLIYFLFFSYEWYLIFALVTATQFSRCNQMHKLFPRACWFSDMKEGAFLSESQRSCHFGTGLLNLNNLIVMISQNDEWLCCKFRMISRILLPQ